MSPVFQENSSTFSGQSPLQIDFGNALLSYAGQYHSVLASIMEAVQNALDEDASNVEIMLCEVNKNKSDIIITDDGIGRNVSGLEKTALSSIGKSTKQKGKLGRFGIGFMAFFGKCDYFTFTSCPKGKTDDYTEWEFNYEKLNICDNNAGAYIPWKKRLDLRYSHKLKGSSSEFSYVPWRSRLHAINVERDFSKLDPEGLGDAIVERFNTTLCRQGTIINLVFQDKKGKQTAKKEIRGIPFEGERLDELTLWPYADHMVVVRLFLASRTFQGCKGRVVVGEYNDEYRRLSKDFFLSCQAFMNHADLNGELKDVRAALSSGIFEGEILSNKCQWDKHRNNFGQERLLEFFIALKEWYDKVGHTHIEKANEEKSNERWREVGKKALNMFADMLRDPRWAHLYEQFKVGSTGIGHASPKEADIVGETDAEAIKRRKIGELKVVPPKPRPRNVPEKENIDHHPKIISTPENKGRTRILVRNSSIGLHLSYSELRGFRHPFCLHKEQMLLEINTLHPSFVLCDTASKTAVERYTQTLIMHAFTIFECMQSKPEMGDIFEVCFEKLLEKEVYQFINEHTPRKKGRIVQD